MKYLALHSPSCCLYNGDIYVAFYAGKQECVEQSVFIFKKTPKGFSLVKKLQEGSGNPVLMVYKNELFCVYSVFTKLMNGNVFDLWKTTYTIVENVITGNKYVLSTYCCPRNNAYLLPDESIIIPCYDENIERAVLFHLKDGNMERSVCMFDYPLIQPSIVKIDDGFHVLFRNFNRNIRTMESERFTMSCRFGFSTARNRIVFSDLKKTEIPNNNESIATINDSEGVPLVCYNELKGREDLTLGFIRKNAEGVISSDPILLLNEDKKGSYPNMCYNRSGQLNVAFTSYDVGINFSSRICLAKMSKSYDKVLSRDYIDSEMLEEIKN